MQCDKKQFSILSKNKHHKWVRNSLPDTIVHDVELLIAERRSLKYWKSQAKDRQAMLVLVWNFLVLGLHKHTEVPKNAVHMYIWCTTNYKQVHSSVPIRI